MSRQDEIKTILAAATQQAYDQGWADCLAAFKQAAEVGNPAPAAQYTFDTGPIVRVPKRKRRGGRPNSSEGQVYAVIANNPGLSGASVADVLPEIHERTVRTALRRLRISGKIEQKEKRWFPVSGGT